MTSATRVVFKFPSDLRAPRFCALVVHCSRGPVNTGQGLGSGGRESQAGGRVPAICLCRQAPRPSSALSGDICAANAVYFLPVASGDARACVCRINTHE